MADNTPSRRSKTPIPATNVPPTPSRIPVPTQSSSRYTSFASPTKASLARHNPQLLPRATSTGPEVGRSPSKGRVQDVFDRALRNTPQGERGRSVTSGAERPNAGSTLGGGGNAIALTPTRARSVGGGMASKPRRMSRSPAKRPIAAAETPKSNFKPAVEFENIEDIANPFKRTGLRRSPVPGQSSLPATASQERQDDIDPFKKAGLRRSPPATMPASATIVPQVPLEMNEAVSTTPKDPVPFHASTTPKDPAPAYPSTTPKEPMPVYASTTPKDPVPVQALEPYLRAPEEVAIRSRSSSQLPSSQAFGSIDVPGPQVAEPVEPAPPGSPAQPRQVLEEEDFGLDLQVADEIVSTTPSDLILAKLRTLQTDQPFVIDVPQRQDLEDEPQASELPRSDDVNPLMSDDSPAQRKARQLSMSKPAQRSLFPRSKKSFLSPSKRLQQSTSLDEPELPSTPTQRVIADPVVTTRPVGSHNTPSKTARRNRTLGAKLRSSPLKPRADLRPELDTVPEPPAKRRKSARFSIPHDPHAAKKKIRDDLLKELQQLQADVSLGNKENERIRLHHESKGTKVARASNPEEILDLLIRSTASEKQETKPEPISALKATNLFLPFSGRRKARQTAVPQIEKSLPSHLPIPLSNPLPHLQLFSHLTYTSNIILLPPTPTSPGESAVEISKATLQHHQISASHPSGLFSARLSMVVDTSSLTISSLNVDTLDANAEPELGPFVRRRASGSGPFGKDIGTMCWAMGRWTEVSVARAKFWCDAEREFGTSEARKSAMEKQGKRKRKRKAIEDGEEDEGDREESSRKWTRKELFRQMGRTSMNLSEDGVEIRVGWRIGFDWMGDVESHLDIDLDLPSSWHKQDDRNSLSKIKVMFGKLVKEKGPLGALRITVGLIMADSS
ncbi:b2eaa89e-bced-4402-a1ec-460a40f18c50-CDS [Sclerotinia trifoliorum]|uniref:B2eaa89e-bced-4402-a1ec-460a40f18c50-CDS n=1 Tax=Sclerotinia trifoliorum TaxID=28548 RepID=A0A8H2ZLN4_9HELO|nr:b2eaa89e-bced-4402-a1ec-460a40f18c50-CDS [Sclerotinia trifoliorum]